MKGRRNIGEKEKELLPYVVDYVKRKGIDKQDGLAIALMCDDDEKSEQMIRVLRENPDMEFDDLFDKALEICRLK